MGWGSGKTLRGHLNSVLSVSWTACSTFLVSGSVDNTAILWNAAKGTLLQRIEGIRGYVNGVAFDPLGEFLAIQSNDKILRLYKSNSKKTPKFFPLFNHTRIKKYSISHMAFVEDLEDAKEAPAPSEQDFLLGEQEFRHFYRRLEWAPDGSFFLTASTFTNQ